ncbi:DUF3305 domain-containing protein [Vibrio salinus]|uniref:DUF3305 domain-containing protein n=1 Tax=Vibrio salinus TaxID=2899784 RepID=UPI001E3555E0|nr:DUF3305 domain-containing protein [Vibrio salinus]MCE0492525.1 DUF3305 domain-containing protein [Vibrio salinus]
MSQTIYEISDKLRTREAWSIACEFVDHSIITGAWVTRQKQLVGFNLYPEKLSNKSVILNLYSNEKKEYLANLKTGHPKLFVVIDNSTSVQDRLLTITASRKVADHYTERGELVLSSDMPDEVANWVKGYIH